MKGLPLLLRLARQEADGRRVALAAAERARVTAAEQRAGLEAQLRSEARAAQGDAEALALWATWEKAARREAARLDQTLAERLAAEAAIREALREDFATIKRLEITLGQQRLAATRQAARRTEQRQEEAALQRRP